MMDMTRRVARERARDRAPLTGSATAGSPGTVTALQRPPRNLAEAISRGVTASPGTAWTATQRIRCTDGSDIEWNGTTWIAYNG